ncbi:MAG: bacteriocin family protein [Bacilli bacterium]|nr:bacteriocin family protein [Bacilli bacterium]MBN2695953.1 bacteriocin family protein [Bacilli bacterium]
MDLFKQNLAPIPGEAWAEINNRAEKVIKSVLTARKALHVEGPFGFEKTVVSTGRLNLLPDNDKSGVRSGLYDSHSLLETRQNFELSRWELDNVIRGTKDIDLEPLEKAAEAIAKFEEKALYYGNKDANIRGLIELAGTKITLKGDSQTILQEVSRAVIKLEEAYANKPLDLIVGDDFYDQLNKIHGAKLLREIVESVIGGKVIRSSNLQGGLLLPNNHEDLELTIGQDYTIGYEFHDQTSVKFFIMNSFVLNVYDNNLLVRFEI